MKTPITDRLEAPARGFMRNANVLYSSRARRLELDRAALLELVESYVENGHSLALMQRAVSALAAARANFPTP